MKLPRRDYVVLPLLSVLTAVVLLVATEAAARLAWARNADDSCLVHDPPLSDHYKPNCISKMKTPEGPWVLNRYNACGYRSRASCAAKAPGSIRIAVLGTSAAEGHMVPYEQTFTALAEQALTVRCRRAVEIQNLAVAGVLLSEAADRTEEALALKPDLVVLALTPYDLWKEIGAQASDSMVKTEPPGNSAKQKLGETLAPVKTIVRQSSALAMMRYFLYQDPQVYLKLYLRTPWGGNDYLTVPFTPIWKEGFKRFDSIVAEMASKTRPKGIPMTLLVLLFRTQFALMKAGGDFPDRDPYAFNRQIAKIAEQNGVLDFDTAMDFRDVNSSEQLFYIADGHMRESGHEILARSLTKQILESGVLEPAGCGAGNLSNSMVDTTTYSRK